MKFIKSIRNHIHQWMSPLKVRDQVPHYSGQLERGDREFFDTESGCTSRTRSTSSPRISGGWPERTCCWICFHVELHKWIGHCCRCAGGSPGGSSHGRCCCGTRRGGGGGRGGRRRDPHFYARRVELVHAPGHSPLPLTYRKYEPRSWLAPLCWWTRNCSCPGQSE